jgi:hypothetical protein
MTVRKNEKLKPNVPDDPFSLYDKNLKAKTEKSLTKNGVSKPFTAKVEMEGNNNREPLQPEESEKAFNNRRDL